MPLCNLENGGIRYMAQAALSVPGVFGKATTIIDLQDILPWTSYPSVHSQSITTANAIIYGCEDDF